MADPVDNYSSYMLLLDSPVYRYVNPYEAKMLFILCLPLLNTRPTWIPIAYSRSNTQQCAKRAMLSKFIRYISTQNTIVLR